MNRPLALAGSLAATVGILAGSLVSPSARPATARRRHQPRPVAPTTPTCTPLSAPTSPTPSRSSPTTSRCSIPPAARTSTPSTTTCCTRSTSTTSGDGEDDITYQFNFDTRLRNPNSFLYNTGQITTLDDQDWNQPQTYSVTRIEDGRREVLAENLKTPPVNIGPRSTPNYDSLAAMAVQSLPGNRKVFAGQRDDPFYVDLGSVFDLAGLRPFNPAHLIPLPSIDGYRQRRGLQRAHDRAAGADHGSDA